MSEYPIEQDDEMVDLDINEAGVIATLWSNAPVQSDKNAMVDGFPFYFRARGDAWSFAVSGKGGNPVEPSENIFFKSDHYGEGFDASWMSKRVAKQIVMDCAAEFQARS